MTTFEKSTSRYVGIYFIIRGWFLGRFRSLCCFVQGSHLGAFQNSCVKLYIKFITTLSEGTIMRNPAQTYKANIYILWCVWNFLSALGSHENYGPSPLVLRGGLWRAVGRKYKMMMMTWRLLKFCLICNVIYVWINELCYYRL